MVGPWWAVNVFQKNIFYAVQKLSPHIISFEVLIFQIDLLFVNNPLHPARY
jgi:hypothetical protein